MEDGCEHRSAGPRRMRIRSQRNLQNALPEMVGQLRNSPENLTATFKLYRNLDALYDVFASVVESSGAFGSRDEFQSLQNDFNALERSRHAVADRMEALTQSKEVELTKLRTELQNAQAAAVPPAPPKKVVVDDTEPAVKKAPSKKSTSKAKKTPPATAPLSSQSDHRRPTNAGNPSPEPAAALVNDGLRHGLYSDAALRLSSLYRMVFCSCIQCTPKAAGSVSVGSTRWPAPCVRLAGHTQNGSEAIFQPCRSLFRTRIATS